LEESRQANRIVETFSPLDSLACMTLTLCVTFLGICFFKHFASAQCMCVRQWDYEKIQKARWKLSTVKKLSNWQLRCTYINFAVILSVLLPLLLFYFVRWMNIYTHKKKIASFKDVRPSNPFFIKVFAKPFESQKLMWN
jgi:hypothetical protein